MSGEFDSRKDSDSTKFELKTSSIDKAKFYRGIWRFMWCGSKFTSCLIFAPRIRFFAKILKFGIFFQISFNPRIGTSWKCWESSLHLWPRMLSTNQNAIFFYHQYLWKGSIYILDFYSSYENLGNVDLITIKGR